MRGKQKLWIMPLIVMMLVSAIMVGANAITTVDSTGYLAFDKDLVLITKGSEPVGWPFFVLKVNISAVTDLSGVVFSVHWDPTLFSCEGGDDNGFIYGTFLPTGLPDATGWAIVWDLAAGNMSEAANAMMSGKPLRTVAPGAWAWVGSLKFKFIGTPPEPGSPVETDILIVNEPAAAMTTAWCENWGPYHDFDNLSPPYVHLCHFKYEAVPRPLESPTASFIIVTPPPRYVGAPITFDAAASTGGVDGDDDTVITEYRWDFGNGTIFTVPAPTTTITTCYANPGGFTVTLEVWAPRIGIYDPAYDAIDTDSTSLPITISPRVFTYIDVYTEEFRWGSGYITTYTGVGPNITACAYSPQENVTLFAKVVYKGDIVQNKPVAFEIIGPNAIIYFGRTAFTDAYGIATISFRIPWPCTNAEATVFGTWTIYATVALPDRETGEEKVYIDVVDFEVGWIVKLLSIITTDSSFVPKDTFHKCECIGIKITLKNIATEDRNLALMIVVYDDAGSVIGKFFVWMTVHPSTTQIELYCFLPVPKHAYCGPYAMVYADAYTNWPRVGGSPWCPEVSHGIEILP